MMACGRSRNLLLLLCAILLLAACGRRGPVLPAYRSLPEAPQKAGMSQQGERFELSWVAPTRNQDGSLLDDLAAFELWRMPFDPADPCPECFDLSERRLRLDPDDPAPALKIGERYYVRDDELLAGSGYQYRIVARNSAGRLGAAATLREVAVSPPPPPSGLSGQGLDRLVRLAWEEPPPCPGACERLGYRVYRSRDAAPFLGPPLHRGLLEAPAYEDLGVENGTSYRYLVRTVARVGGREVESAPSEILTIVPEAGR